MSRVETNLHATVPKAVVVAVVSVIDWNGVLDVKVSLRVVCINTVHVVGFTTLQNACGDQSLHVHVHVY